MGINTFFALATVILAISLAAERLVAIVKTLWPWLRKEQQDTATGEVLPADRWRQLVVLAIAFACSWITAAFLAGGIPAGLTGMIAFPGLALPTSIAGLLATAGSAFWAPIVGYARAAKDLKTEHVRTARALRVTAEADARAHLDRVPPPPAHV